MAKEDFAKLEDTFKSAPNPEVLTTTLVDYRCIARDTFQTKLPQGITRIRGILAREQDPDNVLNPTAAQRGDYITATKLTPAEALQRGMVVLTAETIGDVGMESGNGGNERYLDVVLDHKVHAKIMEICLEEFLAFDMILQDLRIWLEMEVPVIEDGNSFGADVQASLMKDVQEYFKRCNHIHNQILGHRTSRIPLIREWIKFPNVQDYPEAIASSDRFDHHMLRSFMRSLLIMHVALLTKFEKNWEKAINPKGNGGLGAMY